MTRLRTRIGACLAALALVGLGLSASAAAQTLSSLTITSDGVGPAIVGSTQAELASQLGSNWSFVPTDQVIVDFAGFAVREAGETQFYALSGGTDELNVFIIDSDRHTTPEGIGPGSTIDDAVAVYGAATLSFNTENESREFVSFENGPSGRVLFRTGSGDTAGVYGESTGNLNETAEYKPGATIASVWVTCAIGIDCPPVLAYTGPGDAAPLALVGFGLVALGTCLVITARRLD